MRTHFPTLACLSLVLCLSLTLLLAPCAEADELATFDGVEATAVPNIQGVGGPIELTATGIFYGGCCYPLWAHDIVPHIELPPGMENISTPISENIGEVEGTSGGAPVRVDFTWLVKAKVKGTYQINFTIESSDCGQHSTSVMVDIIEGVPISQPQTFPLKPELGEPYRLMLESSSPFETVSVEWVKTYYLLTDSKPTLVKPANDTLGQQKGKEVVMGQDQFRAELWNGQVPMEGQGKYLTLWFVAHDSMDRNTTSPMYLKEVFDPSAKSYSLVLTMGGMLATVLVCWALVVVRSVPPTPATIAGLHPLGRREPITDLTGPTTERKSWEPHRNNLQLVIFALMFISLLIGIIGGHFADYLAEVLP